MVNSILLWSNQIRIKHHVRWFRAQYLLPGCLRGLLVGIRGSLLGLLLGSQVSEIWHLNTTSILINFINVSITTLFNSLTCQNDVINEESVWRWWWNWTVKGCSVSLSSGSFASTIPSVESVASIIQSINCPFPWANTRRKCNGEWIEATDGLQTSKQRHPIKLLFSLDLLQHPSTDVWLSGYNASDTCRPKHAPRERERTDDISSRWSDSLDHSTFGSIRSHIQFLTCSR